MALVDVASFVLAFPTLSFPVEKPAEPPPIARVCPDPDIYVLKDCNGRQWYHTNPVWLRSWVSMQKPSRQPDLPSTDLVPAGKAPEVDPQ